MREKCGDVKVAGQYNVFYRCSREKGHKGNHRDKDSCFEWRTRKPKSPVAKVSVKRNEVSSLLHTADDLFLASDSWDEPIAYLSAWLRAHGIEVTP